MTASAIGPGSEERIARLLASVAAARTFESIAGRLVRDGRELTGADGLALYFFRDGTWRTDDSGDAKLAAFVAEGRPGGGVQTIDDTGEAAMRSLAIVELNAAARLCAVWNEPGRSAGSAGLVGALAEVARAALENARLLAEARRDEVQLQAVLDSVSDCYYTLDREWRLVEFSRSSEIYFNLKREDVIGRSLWDLFPSGRGQAYEDACRAAMDRGERGRLEAPSAFQPGHAVEMRTAPTENGISVAITDITERRRAEANLRRQTRELQAVLDAAPAAIWIARDSEGRQIDGNVFARALLRVPQDANMSKSAPAAATALRHFRVLAADGAEIASDNLPVQRAARGEHVLGFEETIVFDDGAEVHLLGNAVPLRDRSGTVRGSVAAFADVTNLKQVERDLTELTRTLESRIAEAVAEREAALGQLHEAQKTEALGQIAGGVAHDFNNLLAPIIGGLDLLRRRHAGDARTERLIDGAIQSAERARTLVQRMLAFARRQPLQRTAVNVPALLQSLRHLLTSSVGSRIRLTIDADDGVAHALADANQLELALLNLAVNARDAMPDGGALTITASGMVEADRALVCLSVTDTGVGMDAATLKRATEPFFSTKGIGKGTGLGLSMVEGFAAQLGGRLELQSTPGVGTTVTLYLPAAVAGATQNAAPVGTSQPRAAGRVLLVDDEPIVRETTRSMLEDFGYTVIEASSGREALGLVEAGPAPDWLITDHMMAGLTGADLARAVRQIIPQVKVLIISGYAEVDEIAPDLPRLAKPFRQAELAERLAAGERSA